MASSGSPAAQSIAALLVDEEGSDGGAVAASDVVDRFAADVRFYDEQIAHLARARTLALRRLQYVQSNNGRLLQEDGEEDGELADVARAAVAATVLIEADVLTDLRRGAEDCALQTLLSSERAAQAERERDQLLRTVEQDQIERKHLLELLHRTKQRAEAAERRAQGEVIEGQRLAQELYDARNSTKSLEARVDDLSRSQRKQVYGYCAELAKWQV